ncbi:glycosyltransferase [Treponema primitia ZAS-2]|uniref:Glycosyltransferase n=1 Tax=Treponema primitia (strain ATCC BAA-887 / DSM 12427 / ZAS-2) TaxID=545694 RepID=F5YNY4_TREPZ|nr:glycosyltransferase family 2 protein [Treponema primitia]AEF85216.1 glycosyltransferase [Treponema primitia ZAS-2]
MNNKSPLVSVIIPCYNSAQYVKQSILSIINQSYKNIEIIITDDCSTDDSFSVIEGLASIDNRIIVIKNSENLKLIKTLNNAIDIAKGKYIARMDADDISMPMRIEKQVSFMELHSDYAICGTNAWHINERGKIIGKAILPLSNVEIQNSKFCSCPFYHPSVIIRSNILKELNYNEIFIHTEDYALWLEILDHYKGFNLKEKLIKYRKHQDSITQKYKDIMRTTLIHIMSKYLTNKDYALSTLYIDNIFLQTKYNRNIEVDTIVIKNMKRIHNMNGYNFNISRKYYKYFKRTNNIIIFFKELSNINILIFMNRLFMYYLKRVIYILLLGYER